MKRIENSLYGFKDWKIIIKVPFCTNIHGNMSYIAYIFYSINFFSCSFWYFFLRYYSHFVFEGISRLSQKEILFLQGWAIWRGVTVRLTPRSLCCFSAYTCIFHFQSKEITRVVSHSTCIHLYVSSENGQTWYILLFQRIDNCWNRYRVSVLYVCMFSD